MINSKMEIEFPVQVSPYGQVNNVETNDSINIDAASSPLVRIAFTLYCILRSHFKYISISPCYCLTKIQSISMYLVLILL